MSACNLGVSTAIGGKVVWKGVKRLQNPLRRGREIEMARRKTSSAGPSGLARFAVLQLHPVWVPVVPPPEAPPIAVVELEATPPEEVIPPDVVVLPELAVIVAPPVPPMVSVSRPAVELSVMFPSTTPAELFAYDGLLMMDPNPEEFTEPWVGLLRDFVGENGKITPARLTGTRAFYQRQLTTAIKRARFLALLPYSDQHKV